MNDFNSPNPEGRFKHRRYMCASEQPKIEGYSCIASVRGGYVWQSGSINAEIFKIPRKLVVVQMEGTFCDHRAVHNGHNIIAVITEAIEDAPNAVLPDNEYLALVDSIIAYLDNDFDAVIHCGMGISRSSYVTLGVLMRGTKLSFDEALRILKEGRPVANPNAGFAAHVKRLESVLIGNQKL